MLVVAAVRWSELVVEFMKAYASRRDVIDPVS
jgi:hypothetical protein